MSTYHYRSSCDVLGLDLTYSEESNTILDTPDKTLDITPNFNEENSIPELDSDSYFNPYSTLDPHTICHRDLDPSQYTLCREHPDVAASALQGIQVGLHECRMQFKQHRWNCSLTNQRSKIMKKGKNLDLVFS